MATNPGKTTIIFLVITLLVSVFFLFPGNKSANTLPDKQETKTPYNKLAILPIPLKIPHDEQKALLGEKLFHDKNLSPNNVACATCHQLDKAGIDQLAQSINVKGGYDEMNTLTIFNSVFNFRHSWTGNFKTLEEQLNGVIHNPKHMNSSWSFIKNYLKKQKHYQQAFQKLFSNGITRKNIEDVFIHFEKTLITPNAPFDRYLRGDTNALSEEQKKGYQLFNSYGCIACHQGINIGGNLFARFGIYENPFKEQKKLNKIDWGRFSLTQNPQDKHVFRVPSLRNVAKTAPYFHDGRAKSLKAAIKAIGLAQLGREIPQADILMLEAFLHSLTGQYKGNSL